MVEPSEAATGGVLYKNLLLKILQYLQENICFLGCPYNNVAGLQACNFFEKRLQNRCFFRYCESLRLLIFNNIWERLLFDCFNASLLHRPKGSRSTLNIVRIQRPSYRSSFLFLSRDLCY